MIELVDVLYRKKLDKYFKDEQAREKLIQKIEEYGVTFSPSEKITDSIDPDDNIFLELAVASQGRALFQVTLICALNPFREIPILSASDFLKVF